MLNVSQKLRLLFQHFLKALNIFVRLFSFFYRNIVKVLVTRPPCRLLYYWSYLVCATILTNQRLVIWLAWHLICYQPVNFDFYQRRFKYAVFVCWLLNSCFCSRQAIIASQFMVRRPGLRLLPMLCMGMWTVTCSYVLLSTVLLLLGIRHSNLRVMIFQTPGSGLMPLIPCSARVIVLYAA